MINNFLLIFIVCFLTVSAYSHAKNDSLKKNKTKQTSKFIVDGSIKNVTDSVAITLYKGSRLIAIDTMIDGKFRFECKSDSVPTEYKMNVVHEEGIASNFTFWAHKNTTKITGESKIAISWSVHSALKEQKELDVYTQASKAEIKQMFELSIKQYELNKGLDSAIKNVDTIGVELFKNKYDSLSAILQNIEKTINLNNMKILQNTPYSEVWMKKLMGVVTSVAYFYMRDFEMQTPIQELYSRLTSEQKATKTGKIITNKIYPNNIKIGDKMPDATLYDLDGNAYTLSGFKGKYILLDFWSFTCRPCMGAIAELRDISAEYSDMLEVVGISLDGKTYWEKTSKEHDIPWLNLKNNGEGIYEGIAAKYDVQGIPYYVLISPDGKIIDKIKGYAPGVLNKLLQNNNISE